MKSINDTQGHLAGDKALTTVAKCVKDNLIPGCKFYRTGGDEFEILYFKKDISKLDLMLAKIHTDIEKSAYSCAVGKAVRKTNESFEELTQRADDLMYADKKRIKEKAKG